MIIKADAQAVFKCSGRCYDRFTARDTEILRDVVACLSLIRMIAVRPFVGPQTACRILQNTEEEAVKHLVSVTVRAARHVLPFKAVLAAVVTADSAVRLLNPVVFKEIPSALFRIVRIAVGIGLKNAAHHSVCHRRMQLLTLRCGKLLGTLHRAAHIAEDLCIRRCFLVIAVPRFSHFAFPRVIIAL